MRRTTPGFTLIEVLIVISILAIVAAGTLCPIVAPMREQPYAEAEAAGLGGLERLVPALVADAHAATEFVAGANADAFMLPRRSGKLGAVYAVGKDRTLRRAVLGHAEAEAVLSGEPMPPTAVPMLDGVSSLKADLMADGRLRVAFTASRATPARVLPFEHTIEVSLGLPRPEARP